jgi:acetyl esterase/lipase
MANEERLSYTLPEMERVLTRRDITYKTIDSLALNLDVYYPRGQSGGKLHPAVLFLHGDGPPETLADAKDWPQYVQWAQLVASSGLIGITSTHRSTERGTRLNQAAQDVDDLVSFVRAHATDLQIDNDRLGLWTCSAGGPVTLRSVLRDRPSFVRCIVAYYCLFDLRPMHARLGLAIDDATLDEFSPLYLLSRGDGDIAPMFIARAGRDDPDFKTAADAFSAEALAINAPVEIINHPSGQHGFDLRDHDARSREIIECTLAFMQRHLREHQESST